MHDKQKETTSAFFQEPTGCFGRRIGRKLSKRRQALIEDLLPQLAISLPANNQPLSIYDICSRSRSPNSPVLSKKQTVWLEIGFGKGNHLATLAENHPDILFIGCDPFIPGIAALLDKIHAKALENIRLFPDDARLLIDALPDGCIDRVYLLFPCPWPKRRHSRRRFISQDSLNTLSRVMKGNAHLILASDHPEYIRWALFHFLAHADFTWNAKRKADWQRPKNWVVTPYESKALEKGRTPVYLNFQRRKRLVS